MKENRHIQAVPQDVLKQAQTKINEAKALLAPYMIALTPSERHEVPKMGEKTIGFVEKAYESAKANPNLVPPYLELESFATDLNEARGLWTLGSGVRQLYDSLNDTEMAAGSEAFQAALVFYKSVKLAAAQNIPGAKAIYEELRTRFPGYKRRTGEEPEAEQNKAENP